VNPNLYIAGKTSTSVETLRLWAKMDLGGAILATSDTNVAVDNIAEGLVKAGVRVVRVGRAEKVIHAYKPRTVDDRPMHQCVI